MRMASVLPALLVLVLGGCAEQPEVSSVQVGVAPLAVSTELAGLRQFAIGDWQAARPGMPRPGTLLMGGGDWVPSSFHWFAEHAGGGRVVILRASGDDNLQREMYEDIGGVTAVRTLVFDDRKPAFDPGVAEAIAQADAVFIAGGDQARYIRFWKDTPVQQLLNAHVQAGKPIGGTSAGLAILGGWAYGALDGGSIDSRSALADPLGEAVTLEQGFLQLPFLRDVVTDTHFAQRDRQGRLLAFVNKARELSGAPVVGLGVDEDAALTVEADGRARLHRNDPEHLAWLIAPQAPAQTLRAGEHLQQRDVAVIGINGDSELDLASLSVSAPAFRLNVHTEQGQWQIEPLQ